MGRDRYGEGGLEGVRDSDAVAGRDEQLVVEFAMSQGGDVGMIVSSSDRVACMLARKARYQAVRTPVSTLFTLPIDQVQRGRSSEIAQATERPVSTRPARLDGKDEHILQPGNMS